LIWGLAVATAAVAPVRAESVAYDALGRVTSVVTDDGKQTLYSHDKAGNRAQVVINPSGATLPPVAQNIIATYAYGTPSHAFNPLTYVTDPGGLALTLVGISRPQFGTATFSGAQVVYTLPTTNVGTLDTFAYTVTNTAGLTVSGLIEITLKNLPPIANPDQVTVGENSLVTFDPRTNDSDPGGLSFIVTGVTTPGHGAAVVNTGGRSVTYTPTVGYWGTDSFGYTITDTANSSASSTVTATVTALPPIANPYSVGTVSGTPVTFDPRTNDSDPNNLPLTITGVGTPQHGAATINSGASITYTPQSGYTGTDTFSYTIANTGGGSASSTVTANVGVPLSVAVDATTWTWVRLSNGNTHVAPAVNGTPSGGQSPYTYLWQCMSGNCSGAHAASAVSPTAYSTVWTAPVTQDNIVYSSYWELKVTDHLGSVAYSPQVTVTFQWMNGN
jgi:YD repeat-containing protein